MPHRCTSIRILDLSIQLPSNFDREFRKLGRIEPDWSGLFLPRERKTRRRMRLYRRDGRSLRFLLNWSTIHRRITEKHQCCSLWVDTPRSNASRFEFLRSSKRFYDGCRRMWHGGQQPPLQPGTLVNIISRRNKASSDKSNSNLLYIKPWNDVRIPNRNITTPRI